MTTVKMLWNNEVSSTVGVSLIKNNLEDKILTIISNPGSIDPIKKEYKNHGLRGKIFCNLNTIYPYNPNCAIYKI